MEKILKELQEIKRLLSFQKKMLSVDDFCSYTGMSKHHVYHLTSTGKIKFYRPCGKMIFFDAEDVIEFLKQNPARSSINNENRINNYFLKKMK